MKLHAIRSLSRISTVTVLGLAAASTVATLGGCHTGSGGAHSAETIAANTASLNQAKAAFFDGWTKMAGTNFTTDKLGKVFDNSENLVSFDGMSQDKTVIRGWKAYSGIWGPGMNGFTNASLSEAKSISTWIEGDTAITASIARIYGEMPNGQKMDVQGHLTLGWRRIGSQWRIVHEHMSLGVKE